MIILYQYNYNDITSHIHSTRFRRQTLYFHFTPLLRTIKYLKTFKVTFYSCNSTAELEGLIGPEGTARSAVNCGVDLGRPHLQGGSSLGRCYRDTKMEMQGLTDAPNIQSQHGGPHRPALPPLLSATASIPRFDSTDAEGNGAQSDQNNNSRPRTSPFHLLAEHGSGAARSPGVRPQPLDQTGCVAPSAVMGLRHVAINTEKDVEQGTLLGSPELVRGAWKCGDAVMQMALPHFEGEKEPRAQRHLTIPSAALRQQREDGAFSQHSLAGGSNSAGRTGRSGKEVFVVCTGAQERTEDRADAAFSDQVTGQVPEPSTTTSACSMEAPIRGDAILRESTERDSDPGVTLANDGADVTTAQLAVYHNPLEQVVLTNKYGDEIRGQICTENSLDRELDEGSGLVTAMDTSDFISDNPPVTVSISPPAAETFSGTITINNQSILVTIENGVLSLAAPPEGYVHKEDDMLSLKEHLGMKDHEDIVLLNYDSGTKSIGKISTLAVSSSGPQVEPRPGLAVSESDLSLVEDCSLSELRTSLDSCSIIKQEAGVLCAITEADLVTPHPNTPVSDCNNGDLQSVMLIRSKKDVATSFGCPEPGCSSVFDTRQKLKVHLLNHAEDPRPYQCTMEGCGWAFATSYKLKRHLQSHDKQRPHTCQFEGCGRRFTTVYNLKAHIKVHEQDNTFTCEICSERFRSATRLSNHQRVHFEPQRPHKCEFPGTQRP